MRDQLAKEFGILTAIVLTAIIVLFLISSAFGDVTVSLQSKISEPSQNEVTVLVFTASGCGPCKRVKPILIAIRAQGVTVDIIDIDTRRGKILARQYGVTSVPTFFVWTKSGVTRTQNIYVVLQIVAENKK